MIKKKTVNNRICIVTRKEFPKSELIRFAFIDKRLVIDKENKVKSRGFYAQNKNDILEIMFKNKIINKEASKIIKSKQEVDHLKKELGIND